MLLSGSFHLEQWWVHKMGTICPAQPPVGAWSCSGPILPLQLPFNSQSLSSTFQQMLLGTSSTSCPTLPPGFPGEWSVDVMATPVAATPDREMILRLEAIYVGGAGGSSEFMESPSCVAYCSGSCLFITAHTDPMKHLLGPFQTLGRQLWCLC